MAREPSSDGISPTCGSLLSEEYFFHETVEKTFSREEVAFVMVDVWNCGFGPEPLTKLGWDAEYNAGKSFCLRCGEIASKRILPMLEACRSNGITVVHAPTRDIAVKQKQWADMATDLERAGNEPGLVGIKRDDWPPRDWVAAWHSEHEDLFRNARWLEQYYRDVRPKVDIPGPLKPREGEIVISSGAMLHRLLKERGVRVLFYAGFATNMCLIEKPGAVREMHARGYLPIVIRDATTGTENAETLPGLWITRAFIDQIEMIWGYTVTTEEFLQAVSRGGHITVRCRYVRMYKPG